MKAMGGIWTRWGIRGGVYIWGDNGETRPREGEHTFQRKLTCATIWGKQRETRGDKRTHHPTQAHICGKTVGGNGRQDLGKADAASNTGTHVGDDGTQAERGGDKPREDGHTIQHRHTCAETMRGKHPTQTHMWGDTGRQGEARPRGSGCTICGEAVRGNHTLQAHMWDRRKQDLGKVDQHRHACGQKWQIRGGKTSGSWAHHPTQAHMWETMGHKRRQGETRPREGERSRHKGKQRVTRRDKTLGRRTHLTMGDKRRQDPGKADTASNAGTHAGRLGDKGRQDLG